MGLLDSLVAPAQPEKQTDVNALLGSLAQPSSSGVEEEKLQTQELDVLENDDKMVWSGHITRNRKNRVGVDAYHLSGEDFSNFMGNAEYNLNVTHRLQYGDMEGKNITCYMIFIASNDTQSSEFEKNYHSYFASKERAGMIITKNGHNLYLIPSGHPEAEKYYVNKDKTYLLGLMEQKRQ
jgi:hypothetical protein